MITLSQYVGPHASSKDWTPARTANATLLLAKANELLRIAAQAGIICLTNPKTKSQISGSTFGGFRPQNCPIGAPNSHHKEGRGIDIYDPDNQIDAWCMANLPSLEAVGIWLEHPDATKSWSHWQSVPPKSGNRVYQP